MPRLTPEDRATKWSLLVGYNPDSDDIEPVQMEDTNKAINTANYVWDTTTLAWVKQVQNVLVTDSIYLAVDGVEDLIAATNTTYLVNIMASLAVIDDWDQNNRCMVNPIVGQAGVAAGSGAITALTQRVTVATDDVVSTGIASIAGCVGADSNFYVEIAGTEKEILASTTTPLGANSTWTMGSIDVYHYVSIGIFVQSDKAGTIQILFSHNNSDWRSHTFAVPAGTGFHKVHPADFKYLNVIYTNGVQAQGSFILYVTASPVSFGNPMIRIEDEIEGDLLAVVGRSIIAGESSAGGGAYVNVKVNPSGTLEVNANQATDPWTTSDSNLLVALQAQAAQLDTDFGALLVYAEAHDTDFGTMISHLSAIQTAVQIMDDWDLNDRCRVSPITGQDGVQGGEGAINALTQRVTIATDDDMVADMALLRQEVQDHKFDYYLDGWLVDGDTCYTAVVDKAGNYIITKYDGIAGTATYYGGVGGVPSNTGWAALAYDTYDDEF